MCLEYGGVSTAYWSDEGASAEWIRVFLAGYLVPSDAAAGDFTVYSTGDPALFALLQRLVAQEPAVVEKYDQLEIPLTDSAVLIRKRAEKVLPTEDVFYLLLTRERRIVLVTSGNLEVRREEGMQVLRAASKWLLLEKGWIPMHSACVAKDDRVICIAGQKASGKTSTLLNLLARNGCDLVAVDKFLVRDGGLRLDVRGLPGKIGIRVGSAIVQPRLLHWLAEAASFFPHISSDDVQRIAATNTPEQLRTRGEKIHLLPAELAELFHRSVTPTAPLELLLIPFFDLNTEQSRLVEAEPEQAIRTLASCYTSLAGKGEGFLLHSFDLSDALMRERLAALLGKHLAGVATYEVHQNHRTNDQTATLVADLLGSGR